MAKKIPPPPDPLQLNPKAVQMAKQYGASYEEVARWFDQGYAQRDIERAYRLGADLAAEASDIFAMLDAGMDWQQIEKALDTVPDLGEDDDDSAYGDAPPRGRKSRRGGSRRP